MDSPRVVLRNHFRAPFASAVSAARTCYSPRVVAPEEVSERQLASIGALTFDAGHHTVYQHAHFEFGLEGISRQFVWEILHAHPFYNSEQSSQRYVRLDEVQAYEPPLRGEAREIYGAALSRSWERYRQLAALLHDDVAAILRELRHVTQQSRRRKVQRVEREAEKKAIEVARYVIPLAAFTSMVHTVSGLTLHRLRRLMHAGDTSAEAAEVIARMVEAVREVDPDLFDRVGDPPMAAEEMPERRQPPAAAGFEAAFDARLGERSSLLVSYDAGAEGAVAEAYRLALGLAPGDVDDDEALRRVLDPACNPYRLDKLNLSFHAPLMRPLHHARYTFWKRLSHTADSQEQRHRMLPASRPLLSRTVGRRPDYVTPALIAASPAARAVFQTAMQECWEARNALVDLGVRPEDALYVLPNATAVRLVESGDLLFFLHKWVMRTCFNAQEEIYRSAMDEVEQVREVHPRLMRRVGPPCVVRHELARPICTEGDHFCGVPVWLTFPRAARRI